MFAETVYLYNPLSHFNLWCVWVLTYSLW